MITIGPITIMSSKTRQAYKRLVQESYKLHEYIWFSDPDSFKTEKFHEEIRKLDSNLGWAISYTPPEDIE